jgi:hypothetical protein
VIEERHQIGAVAALEADFLPEKRAAAHPRVNLLDRRARQPRADAGKAKRGEYLVLDRAPELPFVELAGRILRHIARKKGASDGCRAGRSIGQEEEVAVDFAAPAGNGHGAASVPRIAGGRIASVLEQFAVIRERVELVEIALNLLRKFVRADVAIPFLVPPFDCEALRLADFEGDAHIGACGGSVDVDGRVAPFRTERRQRQARIEASGKGTKSAVAIFPRERPDDALQPRAMKLQPLGGRHVGRHVGQRLGEGVQDYIPLRQLGDMVRPQQLDLGEDRVVADRHGIEGIFVDALRVKAQPRQRARGGEQGG